MELQQPSTSKREACPEKCEICGDPAKGYHYEVPSCNGCKTFFRRSILDQRTYKPCTQNGKCSVKRSLRHCKTCRFKECVQKGMNPLCIVSSEKETSKLIVAASYLGKLQALRGERIPSPLLVVENRVERTLCDLALVENAHQRIRCSKFNPKPGDKIPLRELLKGNSKLSHEFGEFDMVNVPPEIRKEWSQCHAATRINLQDRLTLGIPYDSPAERLSCPKRATKMWPHADIVYSIEYMKTFRFYHSMNDQEKRSLAVAVIYPCHKFTLAFCSFEANSDVSLFPDGSKTSPMWMSDSATRNEANSSGIQRIKELEMDKQEYTLLKAILVCDPNIAGLLPGTKELMFKERDYYTKCLVSYLFSKRGIKQGPRVYLELVGLLSLLHRISRKQKEEHLMLCVSGLRPWARIPGDRLLLDEIYDFE